MSQIYLFRHGQSEDNLTKTFSGWHDAQLTPLGVQQAQALGEILKDKKFQIAYQSSLSRSTQTLDAVLKFHPECTIRLTDNRIIERSYGVLEGKSHTETIAKFGQEQFDKWHRGWTDKAEGGESYADVEIRVQSFITDLKNKYHASNNGIAISAHGNSIRLFRKIMENAPIEEAVSWTIPYDSYFQYEI